MQADLAVLAWEIGEGSSHLREGFEKVRSGSNPCASPGSLLLPQQVFL